MSYYTFPYNAGGCPLVISQEQAEYLVAAEEADKRDWDRDHRCEICKAVDADTAKCSSCGELICPTHLSDGLCSLCREANEQQAAFDRANTVRKPFERCSICGMTGGSNFGRCACEERTSSR